MKKGICLLTCMAVGMVSLFGQTVWAKEEENRILYRLYNVNSGEHFYTKSKTEAIALRNIATYPGWSLEGVAWVAPKQSAVPVYRLYNENAGDHHYTVNRSERDALIEIGWKDEGIGWYSEGEAGYPVYRQYNPNAVCGAHNFTTNSYERDALIEEGWIDEGIAWYATAVNENLTGNARFVREDGDVAELYTEDNTYMTLEDWKYDIIPDRMIGSGDTRRYVYWPIGNNSADGLTLYYYPALERLRIEGADKTDYGFYYEAKRAD